MKLSEEVARRVLHEMRQQNLRRGERLPSERELMVRLGVGRSTVREVINGLAMLGALEIRHGQGAYVLDPDAGLGMPNTIAAALARGITRDLFEARRLVEVHTARLAAERRTADDVGELEEILVAHGRAVERGTPGVSEAVRFHVRVARASANEMLARAVECFGELLAERGPALEAIPGYREWELDDHARVLAAMRDRDPVAAALRMSEHLDAVVRWHERLSDSDRR